MTQVRTSNDKDNEFLRYSGQPLGPQLRRFEDTPSLFDVVVEHLMPGLKEAKALERP